MSNSRPQQLLPAVKCQRFRSSTRQATVVARYVQGYGASVISQR